MADVRWVRETRDLYRCERGYVCRDHVTGRGWHSYPNGDPRRYEDHWSGSSLAYAKASVERYGIAR